MTSLVDHVSYWRREISFLIADDALEPWEKKYARGTFVGVVSIAFFATFAIVSTLVS
jgi:hypothetical protein